MNPHTPSKTDVNCAIRVREDCAQLFILFSGAAGDFGWTGQKFLKDTGLMSRNLILLKDPHSSCYQRKIMPEADNFPELMDWLQQQIDGMAHVSEVYCIGNSMGAFSAVLAGSLLRVKSVYAIAPIVNLRESHKDQLKALQEKVDLPEEHINLNLSLAQHNGITEYLVYFSKNFSQDSSRAAQLAENPNVILFPVNWHDHSTLQGMAEQGLYDTLLAPFLPAITTHSLVDTRQ